MLRSGFYILIYIFLGLLFITCSTRLPNVKYKQYQTKYSTQLRDDTLKLTVTNTIQSPIRIYLESNDSLLNLDIAQDFPVLLNALKDTQLLIISERIRLIDSLFSLDASSKLGIVKDIDSTALIFDFPFPKGRTYRIMQGYNGKFSCKSSDKSGPL